MIYEYYCTSCRHLFDVSKSVRDIDVSEVCSKCGEFSERRFVPRRLHLMHTNVEHPEYNPGLGCVVKNRTHRKELAKQMGLEEVGNQNIDTWARDCEKIRDDKHNKRYDDAFNEARAMAVTPRSIPPITSQQKNGE